MKKIFLILAITMTLCDYSSAQGFQDKRFSASYELGASFLGRISIWDRFILFRHTADVNYALSKRFTVGLGINHAKKTLPAGTEIGRLSGSSLISFNSGFNRFFHAAQVNDLSFSLNIKYFAKKNGSAAPLGRYVGLMYEHGWQNTFTEFELPDGEFRYTYDDTDRGTLSVVSLTYGRNIIFSDAYLFGYGITVGHNLEREMQFRRFIARPFVSFGILF